MLSSIFNLYIAANASTLHATIHYFSITLVRLERISDRARIGKITKGNVDLPELSGKIDLSDPQEPATRKVLHLAV